MAQKRMNDIMCMPNYKDGSIVNLMSSVLKAYGYESKYEALEILKPDELFESKNIVLIVVDGLGYEYLTKYGKGTVFNNYLKGKITSVFPATTATAITTFVTGVAPQQHAVTGWYVYLKELGLVTTILPFTPRCGGLSFGQIKINPEIIFNQKSVFEKIKANSYYIIHKDFLGSDYTVALSGRAKSVPFNSLTDFFRQIKQVLSSTKSKKYIYAYLHKFDSLCHEYGTKSAEVFAYFKKLNKKLIPFLKSINGTNTTVIITADHGLIDTTESRIIKLKEHLEFVDTLTLPLCGDTRIGYCYVHPSKAKYFEEYVNKFFKNCCELYKAEDLIRTKCFGLFEPSENLFDRVGDYVLIMKENYIIRDFVLGEDEYFPKGNHGGVSKEEMFIPLIVVNR